MTLTLLLAVGIIGAYTSATWVWIFFRIAQSGELLLHEPVRWIAISELAMASAFTLVSIVAIVYCLYAIRRETNITTNK